MKEMPVCTNNLKHHQQQKEDFNSGLCNTIWATDLHSIFIKYMNKETI